MMVVESQRNRAGTVSRHFLRIGPGSENVNYGQPSGASRDASVPQFHSARCGTR